MAPVTSEATDLEIKPGDVVAVVNAVLKLVYV